MSQYNTADPQNPTQPNQDFWGFTPANQQSAYLNSYHVRTGMAPTSGYTVRDGLFAVRSSSAGVGSGPTVPANGWLWWMARPDTPWLSVSAVSAARSIRERPQ